MRLFGIKEKSPLEFLVCGQLISKDNFLHMRRKFSENVLIFVLEGTLHINSNGKDFHISKNQFILLKAKEEHFGSKESEGPLSYYWVHFPNDLTELNFNAQLKSDKNAAQKAESNSDTKSEIQPDENQNYNYLIPETGTFENDKRILILFKQMMDFSLDEQIFNKSILDYSLSTLVLELSQNYISTKNQIKKINPVVNEICIWIKNNFSKNFSMEDLADFTGYQSTYLSNLFKENMNMSIIQYTTDLRINAAKKQLQNFGVKETAYSCGFEDEKYFMKVFKKHEGVTPTQFKQAFTKRNINQ